MNSPYLTLAPETLWDTLIQQTDAAIKSGALHTINTEQRSIDSEGVRFLVRSVTSLKRKSEEKQKRKSQQKKSGEEFNPFLPPEPELTLGAISDSHLCVLNKFNVLEHHLLIITRHFEHQQTLLTLNDFKAQWLALYGIDGLGFYNGGAEAGASQRHKHLQLAPLPLSDNEMKLPMEALWHDSGDTSPPLPFRHKFRRLPDDLWQQPDKAAEISYEIYLEMLEELGIKAVMVDGEPRQSAAYNLLMRRDWMLMVPRSQERFETISINALGFAGSLFVRDEKELNRVEEIGPMHILNQVSK